MSNELEKIKKFITIKRDTVEETIKDENSTKFAVFLIAIALTLSVIQTLLQSTSIQDIPDWVVSFFGITPTTPLES